MKTTEWIKKKSIEIKRELDYIDSFVVEKGFKYEELKDQPYVARSGTILPNTIQERLSSLVGQQLILEEILKG